MNSYGELARDLWRAADSQRFMAMPHRDEFFTDLGESVAVRVAELLEVFAADSPAGETLRCRSVRLRRARKDAEEIAYQELIFSHSVASENDDFVEVQHSV